MWDDSASNSSSEKSNFRSVEGDLVGQEQAVEDFIGAHFTLT
jgi:hypothetical protein